MQNTQIINMICYQKPRLRSGYFRNSRWLRNWNDSHDPNSIYDSYKKFGIERERERRFPNPTKPSELMDEFLFRQYAPELLDPYYTTEQLQVLYMLAKREKITKKDFISCPEIFTPRIALYLMFMSEDDIFTAYLHAWRKYASHKSLTIPNELIHNELRCGCSCSGCFGACVRLAQKYKLLPDKTDHIVIESERS